MTFALRRRTGALTIAALTIPAALAACTSDSEQDHDHGSEHDHEETVSQATEVRSAQTRLAVSTDGGVLIVDVTGADKGETPEVLEEFDASGYLRLNGAGDGRHVFVSTGDAFRALDLGAYAVAHGDHSHYYAGDPQWTELSVHAGKPGHVVADAESAVLFDDDSGTVTTVTLSDLVAGDPDRAITDSFTLPVAHHGIAVRLADGNYLTSTTDGTETRNGLALVDNTGRELAAYPECPGLHGGEVAAGGYVLAGCTDGALIWHDGAVTKVQAPDAYGRIGNQAGSEDSRFILGDYKVDQDAELERPTRVSIIDTTTAELKLVELGTSYSFRSLGMTEEGTAVVLGTDGKLHLINPESGEVTTTIDVVSPWEEPVEWQVARPTLYVDGDIAYVTDPSDKSLHVVDLTSGAVTATATLPAEPDELTGA